MTMSNVSSINDTVQKTQVWLKELTHEGHYDDEPQAYSALRSVLHALRDRLTVDEAADLASQLPMLVRGIYYEGWKPAATPKKYDTAAEFREEVEHNMGNGTQVDPDHASRTVFRLLTEHVTGGQLAHVIDMLPEEVRGLWAPKQGGDRSAASRPS